jgi:hypothetical protein
MESRESVVMEDTDLDKIYVICCDQSLSSMGLGHIRTAVDGVEESVMSLDWTQTRSVPILSIEDAQFQAGQTLIVRIKPIEIPPRAAIIRSFYGSNGMGNLQAIGSTEFKTFDEERLADRAMFHSRITASMFRGDLLGHVFIIPSNP